MPGFMPNIHAYLLQTVLAKEKIMYVTREPECAIAVPCMQNLVIALE